MRKYTDYLNNKNKDKKLNIAYNKSINELYKKTIFPGVIFEQEYKTALYCVIALE